MGLRSLDKQYFGLSVFLYGGFDKRLLCFKFDGHVRKVAGNEVHCKIFCVLAWKCFAVEKSRGGGEGNGNTFVETCSHASLFCQCIRHSGIITCVSVVWSSAGSRHILQIFFFYFLIDGDAATVECKMIFMYLLPRNRGRREEGAFAIKEKSEQDCF